MTYVNSISDRFTNTISKFYEKSNFLQIWGIESVKP